MELVRVKIKKLDEMAQIPAYAKPGDAGMDLVAISKEKSDQYIEYGTGLAIEIPEGYVGLIFPRSSISKKQLTLCNSVGVIDSGYRGEVKFRFNYNPKGDVADEYHISDKVGQLIIMPYPTVVLEVVDDLEASHRGEGGFGSSGK